MLPVEYIMLDIQHTFWNVPSVYDIFKMVQKLCLCVGFPF